MSSAGNRGMISNNAGSPNWNFKRNSRDAGEKDASTAERRRVSVVLSVEKELSTSLHSLNICFTEKRLVIYIRNDIPLHYQSPVLLLAVVLFIADINHLDSPPAPQLRGSPTSIITNATLKTPQPPLVGLALQR